MKWVKRTDPSAGRADPMFISRALLPSRCARTHLVIHTLRLPDAGMFHQDINHGFENA